MFNITICIINRDDDFLHKLKIPALPKKGDRISVWIDNANIITRVKYLNYEFDKKGNLEKIEVVVKE